MTTCIAILPCGEARAVYDDRFPFRKAFPQTIPRRASQIEVIEEGSRRGEFCVSFALLAAQTGNPAHTVCLAETFESYDAARRAEVAWLMENYVAQA